MGIVLRRHHRRLIPTLTVYVFLLLISSSISTSIHRFSGGLGQGKKETAKSVIPGEVVDEKRLLGLGSMPPKCRSKCGTCEPCKPVHVLIQPNQIKPMEYYPEAWRCKCGNKIFMP